MPTVSALVWKNLMMHPVYGVLAHIWRTVGLTPVDWFGTYPLMSVVIVVELAMAAVRDADPADRAAIAR